jgi:hypothetical protein
MSSQYIKRNHTDDGLATAKPGYTPIIAWLHDNNIQDGREATLIALCSTDCRRQMGMQCMKAPHVTPPCPNTRLKCDVLIDQPRQAHHARAAVQEVHQQALAVL